MSADRAERGQLCFREKLRKRKSAGCLLQSFCPITINYSHTNCPPAVCSVRAVAMVTCNTLMFLMDGAQNRFKWMSRLHAWTPITSAAFLTGLVLVLGSLASLSHALTKRSTRLQHDGIQQQPSPDHWIQHGRQQAGSRHTYKVTPKQPQLLTTAHRSGSQHQQQQHLNLQQKHVWRHGDRSSSSSSSSGTGASFGRSLQQSATVYQPPKLFISAVKAKVVNTYNWQITRQSSATSVSLLASGQERKQMGKNSYAAHE